MPVSRAFFTCLPGSPVINSPLQVPLTELSEREREREREMLHPTAPFTHLSKSLVNEIPSRFPSGTPMERVARLQSLFYTTFRVPSKEAPLPSRFSSQSAHTERCSVSRVLLQLSLFPLNGPPHPPHASQRGPYGERCPSPEPSTR